MYKYIEIAVPVCLFLFLSTLQVNAQEFELVSGNPKLFKHARNLYLTFEYTDLHVGEYGDEEAYIKYMKDDAERRKKGSSETWLTKWYEARIEFFQPKFVELFVKYSNSKKVNISEELNNQLYELNIHTVYIEAGFNKNGKRAPALIDVIVTISEINKTENQLVISAEGIPGNEVMNSYSPDYNRIAEAYAKLGKELAKYMSKVIY
ncbi:MAG: hypothetical protein KQH67_02475 [Bacteroidetes bacterium]|nr:hypothetical protein [Bacteroidota bacterium]